MFSIQCECLERVREACEPLLKERFPKYDCEPGAIDRFVSYIFGATEDDAEPFGAFYSVIIHSSRNKMLIEFSCRAVGPEVKILEVTATAIDGFISSQFADEVTRHLWHATGLQYTTSNLTHTSQYRTPPLPSEEEIARWREWTHVNDLFTQD